MDLNKHIYKNDNLKPFHSNGYAEVANSNHFGASSNTSFEQRNKINQNRQSVPGYRSSSIGSVPGGQVRESPTLNNRDRSTRALSRSQMQQLKQSNILSRTQLQQIQRSGNNFIVPTRQFQEPASRRYNPYQ